MVIDVDRFPVVINKRVALSVEKKKKLYRGMRETGKNLYQVLEESVTCGRAVPNARWQSKAIITSAGKRWDGLL